jgi:predicted CXXCH cytochrome family protein
MKNPRPGLALFTNRDDVSDVCLDCHNYDENHHPVNFAPETPPDPAYPLFNGKMKCLTCHEIHGGPRKEGSPKQLRGGPYADHRTICFNCHSNEKYADINPHLMLDKNGKIRNVNGKPVCLLCHEVQPDPAQDKVENVYFRADVGFLCWRCHPSMHGSFFEKHFLVWPSEATLEYMNRPEVKEKFALPLIPWGRINCSTCHNPHQEGVIMNKQAAAGADSKMKLRAENLCEGCHEIY